jgi:hypothetical protein
MSRGYDGFSHCIQRIGSIRVCTAVADLAKSARLAAGQIDTGQAAEALRASLTLGDVIPQREWTTDDLVEDVVG